MKEANLIGSGGFGAVYKAQWGERWVAAKNLWILENPEMYGILRSSVEYRTVVAEFIKEANILASASHPNIVEFIGIVATRVVFGGEGETGRKTTVPKWIVTELATSTAARLIEENPDHRIPLAVGVSIIMQALQGLIFLHHLSFVHRDVKPANILLFPNDVAKLCDLGIARQAEKHKAVSTMTQTGTPAYFAPEVSSGRYGMSADIYSVALTLVEMLTGTLPPISLPPLERLHYVREQLLIPPFSLSIRFLFLI